METGRVTGILLAAGDSSRFGSNKLLRALSNGYTIGISAARSLSERVDDLTVVVARSDDLTDMMFKSNAYKTIVAENSNLGMGNSLKSGIWANKDSFGWLVGLADMPYIGVKVIESLVFEIRNGAKMCAPFCEGARGHPVGFGRVLKEDLLCLGDASGASGLLQKYRKDLIEIPTEDKGVLHDIDFPSDII